MKLIHCAAAAAIAGALLAGCEQRSEHTVQTTPAAPPVQASDVTPTPDPSLPRADVAAISKPDQDAAVTESNGKKDYPAPAAGTGSDAAHSATTAAERSTEMPLKGQVNDYNTPDRAKEADQPNTASQEPGGQEANPGNGQTAGNRPPAK
jgi:hypothetical protein